jgi:hypothetical protein
MTAVYLFLCEELPLTVFILSIRLSQYKQMKKWGSTNETFDDTFKYEIEEP